MSGSALELRLHAVTHEATGVLSFEFRSPSGEVLPPFSAGSHVDLHLPDGLIRSYSLVNSQEETHRYLVAVNKDPASRGGSLHMHEHLQTGQLLRVSVPRNNFALREDAETSVFLAGGIGVTPILCMIERLTTLKRGWTLYYCARTRGNAAYLERLQALEERSGGRGALHLHFDQGDPANAFDITAALARAPADAHLYCCGPLRMLASFEQATLSRDAAHVHVEYFSAKEAPAAQGGFDVELARTGKVISIARGSTILDALLAAGVDVPYSCREGICGSCEARVLDGIPDHKDLVLSKEEQASNSVMMVCCSGARTSKLVLDL